MELAITCFRAGKYAEASAQFQKLIERKPNSAELYVRVGEAKKSPAISRAPLRLSTKPMNWNPETFFSHLDLAMTYEQTGHRRRCAQIL